MPINDLVAGQNSVGAPLVRTEPVQERSAARVDALLDAAADVVDEIGFDRLTTAMVAERAGASIGTVYRYFPDRIVLLQALRDRALLRYRHAVVKGIHTDGPERWWDAVECAIDAFVGMFRSELGFRIICLADAERAGAPGEESAHEVSFAAQFAEILSDEYGLPAGDELTFRLEVVVEMIDALVTRAFQDDLAGDERFIVEARTVAREYLERRYSPEE
ncbi:TetR family transcriptional regulator [Leifsonia xyli subsp. xyli]|uniref:Transcriptional regulator, TetR family n=2 Tax=Leifsonia xyli subsp. xyli TaxID=59736 RepID=G1UBE5_LEIXX|nr:TetR/AcrR family transcriptional regulator [Leifsonia xyli]AAP55489.1 TetR-like transcriptional regulator [Leifsonia xyli subsp. xyli]AAT89070.1 transcriptional regulator, TetR family [Leifsonia xyli subsp. xyli str. CTCB07]ODA90742.1 TetR family transcriptional regulator [Leifsonia xyli subsp. xyli]